MRTKQFLSVSMLALFASGAALGQAAVPPPDNVAGPAPLPANVSPSANPAPTPASEPGGEIIVTATKRAQSLQDIPLSVSVTSVDTIEKAQIRDLIDLQSVVPSLKIEQLNASGQTDFYIRGFGNGNGNDGIESSVGVFVDGVYRSRTFSSLDDLPEVQRIEVLRGPQSTLFGKNVSAGAISIITQKPQFNFGAKAEISTGNYGLIQARAYATGPVNDKLAIALFGAVDEREGYLTNVITGAKINDRNRKAVRADILWNPTDNLSIRVIGDYNESLEKCCGVVTIQNGPATQFIGAPKPFGLGAAIGDPANKYNGNIYFSTDPKNRLFGGGGSAQIDWNIGFATATSITAYRRQLNQSVQDVDFTGADIASKNERADVHTFTQEFRLASNGKGRLNWLVGGFYEDETLFSGRDTTFGTQIRPYIDGLVGGPATRPFVGRSNLFVLEYLQSLVTPSIIPGQTYFKPGQGVHDFYHLQQTSYSLFGQADYKVLRHLTITGGVAYLNDRKAVVSDVVLTDQFSALNLQNVPQLPFVGVPANAFAGLGAVQFFYGNTTNHAPINFPNATDNGILKGDKITYSAKAAYDFGRRLNVYFSYSTGWKASAYNLSSDSRPTDPNGVGRTAAPENVTVYEVGAKASFRGGFFNIALFDQAIKGFQSNAYTGTGYILTNAGKESVRGVEVDTAYAPARWLALTGAVTYLDPKYDSFKFAACAVFDTVRCPTANGQFVSPFRDLSGTKPGDIAEWTASMSATLSHEFGDGLGGYLRGEYDYTSSTLISESSPPPISTFSRHEFNASLGLTAERAKLEAMLWVRNLTNDRYLIATFPTVAQTGSYSAYPNLPRTYGVTFRKRF